MELQERTQKIRELIDDDEALKSWIRRAKQGWITGYEFLALVHYSIYDPDNKDQNSEKIVDDWTKALNGGLSCGIITPFSKHSYKRLALENIKNSNGEWLIAVSDADHLLEEYSLAPFIADTINFLFEEVFPEDVKKQTPEKDSPRMIDNLCRAIACLTIDGYGYQPNDKKSPVPGELKMMFEQFDFVISDKTIRDWIKKGVEDINVNRRKS